MVVARFECDGVFARRELRNLFFCRGSRPLGQGFEERVGSGGRVDLSREGSLGDEPGVRRRRGCCPCPVGSCRARAWRR